MKGRRSEECVSPSENKSVDGQVTFRDWNSKFRIQAFMSAAAIVAYTVTVNFAVILRVGRLQWLLVKHGVMQLVRHRTVSGPLRVRLLLEDVGEATYRVDRALVQLERGGWLAGLAGIVLGEFTGCNPGADGATVPTLVAERLGDRGIPVADGYPAAHGARNHPFVHGGRVELRCDGARAELRGG